MIGTPPNVVVACAWYNRADFVRGTIDSLLAQDFNNFEIVVVNDGSTDSRVQEVLDTYDDPRLLVIHQENTGFVAALRRAISASNAPYIAIQDAGDISYPSRLSRQVRFLQENPTISGVGCVRKERVIGGPYDGLTYVDSRRAGTVANTKTFLKGRTPLSHGTAMFRRCIYEEVGGYRDYFKFSQDRDLWIRMSRHGPFHILGEELYQRNQFYHDGVVADVEKRLLQSILSEFAKQCHYDREALGYDLIDRYGIQAGLIRSPSRAVSAALSKFALVKLFYGDPREAEHASVMALREKKTIFSMATRLLVGAGRRSSKVRTVALTMISRLKPMDRMRTDDI